MGDNELSTMTAMFQETMANHATLVREGSAAAVQSHGALLTLMTRSGAPNALGLETLAFVQAMDLVKRLDPHVPLDGRQLLAVVHGLITTFLGTILGGQLAIILQQQGQAAAPGPRPS
jgi:hypothetical protein